MKKERPLSDSDGRPAGQSFHHFPPFFSSRRANTLLGFITGVLSFTPYHHWRWEHALHHASAGDPDRRGTGDVWTMTVQE